jgi:hypothetical protein
MAADQDVVDTRLGIRHDSGLVMGKSTLVDGVEGGGRRGCVVPQKKLISGVFMPRLQ